jgi:hypothetical protein
MRHVQHLIASIAMAVLLTGCARGHSQPEPWADSSIPGKTGGPPSGIVKAPTDAEVRAAVESGISNKENDSLAFAYMTKVPTGISPSNDMYLKVSTPLFLVASHAREQTRAYRKPDDSFVSYARNLKAVKISLTQGLISTVNLDDRAFEPNIVLLRDGFRVPPLPEIPAWAGENPFSEKPIREVRTVIAQVNQAAAELSRNAVAKMTREQKQKVLNKYRALGWSEDQMTAYTGLQAAEIREMLGPAGEADPLLIPLSDSDAVFPVEELARPGRYEIILHVPKENKEFRFPVSFARFR